MRLPDQFLESVVFLYRTNEEAHASGSEGGTGFVVEIQEPLPNAGAKFIITCQHVVQQSGAFVRINRKAGGVGVHHVPAHKWIQHPDGDDVAVAPLSDVDRDWALSAIPWPNGAAGRDAMRTFNVGIGDDVIMLGRFAAHTATSRNQPLARFGAIAMMPGEPVQDGRNLWVEAYLVEMRSLSGFSGSPVIVYMAPGSYRGDGRMVPFYEENYTLIGMDTGHKNLRTKILDGASNTPVREGWIVQQNTGVSIVTPSWKIQETLDQIL